MCSTMSPSSWGVGLVRRLPHPVQTIGLLGSGRTASAINTEGVGIVTVGMLLARAHGMGCDLFRSRWRGLHGREDR